ncbi:DNA polymerase III subunit gamma/tau [Mycoplasmatota bacterium]|nr:DNA polymerase III subunit gamma/tau [Mycoplasmatota bacterium]
MSYKALYRAYRPQRFLDIAGQKHVTKTFQNALKNEKISHAYLFSGPRGTGKTSIAKIIANVVNCESYPISEPCGTCDNCLTIQKGMFSDIIEIDAASNNGVDEIREIRDKVKYTPSQGKYKVYIIDEVHMLSIGAFNALLKTLEEPPSHVIFILATTEPHKIPATIHSRCQRFDFKEISIKDIKTKLKEIIDKEAIKVTLEAIDAIAEAAEGGMRDALSLLDQSISYSDDVVNDKDVHAVAGTVSDIKIIDIFENISNSNVFNAFMIIDELIENGKEINRVNYQMIVFLKDILVLKNVSTDNFGKAIFSNKKFIDLANKLNNEMIFFYIECLSNSQREMRFTNNPRTFLELTLIKMTDFVQQGEAGLYKRIEELEKKISEGLFVKESEIKEVKNVVIKEASIEPEKEIIEEDSNIFDEPEKKIIVDVFDVNIITSTLSLAMSNKPKAKENKEKLSKLWNQINIKAEPHVFAVAKEFSQGEVVVASEDFFIIIFDHVVTVNKLMRSDVRKKMIKLLKDVYNQEYNYMALPKEVWALKRKEYVDQFSVGILEPVLSMIDYPGLEVVEEKKESPEIVKRAIELFGEEKINIK